MFVTGERSVEGFALVESRKMEGLTPGELVKFGSTVVITYASKKEREREREKKKRLVGTQKKNVWVTADRLRRQCNCRRGHPEPRPFHFSYPCPRTLCSCRYGRSNEHRSWLEV
jgi:hypothetical protein